MKLAFLGLGAMGSPMAASLLAGGMDLTVWNRDPTRSLAFKAAGAQVAPNPNEAVAEADLVFAMLRDDDASKAVWGDDQTGAMATMKRGAVAIDMSTLSLKWVAQLHAQAVRIGVAFVDAPVSGSTPAARDQKLVFLAGGDTGVVARVSPTLRLMGQAVHHVGPAGSGMATKLMVNGLLGLQAAAAAEWLGWVEQSQLDTQRVLQAVTSLSLCSGLMKTCLERMSQREFGPLFPLALLRKDLAYAQQAANSVNARMPLLDTTQGVCQRLEAAGLDTENYTALYKLYATGQSSS